jgi:hypothetical protein
VIAEVINLSRSTMFEHLSAHNDGRDRVLVVYRNSKPRVDPDPNRRYGETSASERIQLEADRKWYPIAPAESPSCHSRVDSGG